MDDKKKTLALLIPTKNRPESIRCYMESCANKLAIHGIDIVIYDSSESKDTELVIVDLFERDNITNVQYVHYPDNKTDIHGEKKTRDALYEVAKTYKYVWLSGDQTMINIEEVYDRLERCIYSNFDLIHMYRNDLGIRDMEYEKYNFFFRDFFWSMTHWCSYVLSSRIIAGMKDTIDKYIQEGGTNFLFYAMFMVLPSGRYRVYYIHTNSLFTPAPQRTLSTSYQKHSIMTGWINMIYDIMHRLPNYYNNEKPEALYGIKRNIRILSYKGTVLLRATDNIDLSLYNKYFDQIKYMAGCPLWWIKLWSVIPISIAKTTLVFGKPFIIMKRGILSITSNNHMAGTAGGGFNVSKRF